MCPQIGMITTCIVGVRAWSYIVWYIYIYDISTAHLLQFPSVIFRDIRKLQVGHQRAAAMMVIVVVPARRLHTMTTHRRNALTVLASSAHSDSHSLSINASRSPYMLLAYVRPNEAAAAIRWTIYSRDSSNGSKSLESSKRIYANIILSNTGSPVPYLT